MVTEEAFSSSAVMSISLDHAFGKCLCPVKDERRQEGESMRKRKVEDYEVKHFVYFCLFRINKGKTGLK